MFCFGLVGLALTLAALAVIADFSDGEVSRFHNTKSKEGTYLDNVHHFVVQPYFIAGVVFWGFDANGNRLFLAAGMVSVINSIILTVVVMTAVDSALLKHLMRHIKNGGLTRKQSEAASPHNVGIQDDKIKFIKTIPGTLGRMTDFPYVIVILGLVVALMHYDKNSLLNLDGNLLTYVIYLYALLTASLIFIFVWNVVRTRHIEKRLSEIV
jgi:hypothetical protein